MEQLNTNIIYVVTDEADYFLITADDVPSYVQKSQIEIIYRSNQSVIIGLSSGREYHLWNYANVSGDASGINASALAEDLNNLLNP